MQKIIKILTIFLFFNINIYSQNHYDIFFKLSYFNAFQIYDSSFIYSNKLISENKNYTSSYYILSQQYFKQNNYVLALKNINFALNIDENNLYYNILKFKILIKLNQYSDAKSLSNKILSNTTLETVFLDILYDISFISDIEFFFKKYTSLFPMNDSFYDICINSLINNYNQQHFINYISYIQHYSFINYPKLIDLLSLSKNVNSEIILKNTVISNLNNTNNKDFLLLLAHIYLDEINFDSSFFYFKLYFESIYSDFNSINYFLEFNKSIIITPNNQFIDLFENEISKNNYNNEFSAFLSNFYLQTNNFYKSISIQHNNLNFSNLESCINYLSLLYRFDLFNEMDSISSELIILYPFDSYILLFSSISSIFLSKYENATNTLNKLYLSSYNDSIILSYFYFYTYVLKSKLKESNSIEFLTKATKYASINNSLILNFSYYISKYLKDNKLAIDLLQNIDIPNNPSSMYILSFLYYNNNELNKSLDYINKAIENSRFNNFIYYELKGNILKKLGLNDEAEKYFNISIKYGNIRINKSL